MAHVPHFGPPLFSTVPVVVTIHDLIPLVLPAYRGSLAVRAYTALAAQSARRARMIIADSEASRRDILARLRVAPERVRVVYLAASPRYHPADRVEIARVRARYHLPERFVLYLGGFDVRKNVRLLVDAFESLPDQRVGWKLVLAGQIPEPASDFFPDPRPGASSAVLCIGHVAEEDKPALYSAAGLFAYPSLYEGFGLPPLEAMACGTPVICSDSSSLPEIVGEAGMMVGPSNGQAWAAALRALIRDEAARSELSGRGIERAAKFSWERTAKETLEVYQAASI